MTEIRRAFAVLIIAVALAIGVDDKPKPPTAEEKEAGYRLLTNRTPDAIIITQEFLKPAIVKIGGNLPLATFSNVVSICLHTNDCYLIRYKQNGITNDFHAWMVTFVVEFEKGAVANK